MTLLWRVDQANWQLLQHPRYEPLRRNKHQYVLPLLQLDFLRSQRQLKLGFLVLFFVELDERGVAVSWAWDGREWGVGVDGGCGGGCGGGDACGVCLSS